jgi:predicted transcriptional regulator
MQIVQEQPSAIARDAAIVARSTGVGGATKPWHRARCALLQVDVRLRLRYGCGMSRPAVKLSHLTDLDPRDAAARLAADQRDDRGWLDEFAESLDRYRAAQSFARVLSVWDLSRSEAARFFGVSRQALSKWLRQGVPAERSETVADLAAATDLLVHHLKRDRIPGVVRRPASELANRSLLDLLAAGDTRVLLAACRDMFRFEQASQ